MRWGVLILLPVLGACATAQKVPLPNNEQGFAVECPKPSQCYSKAQEVCGVNGYEMVSEGNRPEGAMVPMATGGMIGSFGSKTTLIVKCK